MDTRPGRVRDTAIGLSLQWIKLLADAIADARAEGSLDAGEDPDQLAFELNAYLLLANAQFVALQNGLPIARAKSAIAARLAAAGAAPNA